MPSARGFTALCALGCFVFAAPGCGSRREANCRFGQEQRVFTSTALAVDDVALAERAGGASAVFSDVSGLLVRALDDRGQPKAAAVRVAERCLGGVDAVADGATLYVACLRPSDGSEGTASHAVWLYALDAGGNVAWARSLGSAGSRSRGIALLHVGQRVLVGWQDAVVGASRAWLAEISLVDGPAALQPTLRVISDAAQLAGAPSLALRDGRVFGVWSERAGWDAASAARLMFGEVGRARAPVALMQVDSAVPDPTLIALSSHWVVAFRDTREESRKTGLYVVGVGQDGDVLGEPLRVARADGEGRPVLRACTQGLVASAPRTFGGDYFVGVVGVDTMLTRVSGEQQFYEDSREFWQVAAACSGVSALMLIGERGKQQRSTGALRAVPFVCH